MFLRKKFLIVFLSVVSAALAFSAPKGGMALKTGDYSGVFYKDLQSKEVLGDFVFKYDEGTPSFEFQLATNKDVQLSVYDTQFEGMKMKDITLSPFSGKFIGKNIIKRGNAFVMMSDPNDEGLVATLFVQTAIPKNKKILQVIGISTDIRPQDKLNEALAMDDPAKKDSKFTFTLYVLAEYARMRGEGISEVAK